MVLLLFAIRQLCCHFDPVKRWLAYQYTPEGPEKIPVPSRHVLQSLSEQQAAQFTPDGQSRKVLAIRAMLRKGLSKLKSPRRRRAASLSTLSHGAMRK